MYQIFKRVSLQNGGVYLSYSTLKLNVLCPSVCLLSFFRDPARSHLSNMYLTNLKPESHGMKKIRAPNIKRKQTYVTNKFGTIYSKPLRLSFIMQEDE